MRIAVGGFMHETNTFVARPTRWADFAEGGPWPQPTYGEAIFPAFEGLNLGIAHFIARAREAGHEILPLAWACAMPGGKVEDAALEHMAQALTAPLSDARVDAVFLELHGAMVTESEDDGEGALLKRLRAVIGPDIPVLVSLDLHANVSAAMVELADFVTSYRTYPHDDWGPTGGRCALWLDRVMQWRAARGRNARAFRQAPYLIPIPAGSTYLDTSRGLYETLERIEAETGVHLTLNIGFPPADIPDVGPSIIAYGPDQASTDAAADRLFAALLDAEDDYARHNPLAAAEVVAEAARIASGASKPVIIADTQDNPGAGAPSNTTGLIAELLRQKVDRAVVGIFHAPDIAHEAHRLGIGGVIDSLSGPGEGPGQEPVPGPWTITALSDGSFRGTAPMLRTPITRMGPTALLTREGVSVLVVAIRQQPIHRETFTHIGVDLARVSVLVLKSSAHFRSGFQEIAETVLIGLAPGTNPDDPQSLDYRKIRIGVRRRPVAAGGAA
ncbi:MAG: M81 family metallopeptidase [Salinarimonas sp.]